MKWKIVPRTEQETIMSIDYFEKTISVYTSRKQVGERLYKKLGEPTYSDTQNGFTTSVTYVRNLFDDDVSKFFSKMLLIGVFRDNNISDDEILKEEENYGKE